MKTRNAITMAALLCVVAGGSVFADCPSGDLNGDCFVDFEELAVIGAQWLNGYDWHDVNTLANQWLTTDPCVPEDMTYIPDGEFEMGDHHGDGYSNELPVHAVFLDSFCMGKYEITNGQYCQFLNSAPIKVVSGTVYSSSDDSNSYPYFDTSIASSSSQIDYSGGVFSVRTKGGRDMSNDPVPMVSWYGSAAYCNWRSQHEAKDVCYNLSIWQCDFTKHGYRLATEAEWEYAARGGEHNPYYRFPWGDTISHSQATYYSYWVGGSPQYPYDVNPTKGYHPDWNDGIWPYTAPVGSFPPNGYGLYEMTGNLWEWCNDRFGSSYYSTSPYDNPQGPASGTFRVYRGGGYAYRAFDCRLAYRPIDGGFGPDRRSSHVGFRVVLDL